MSRNTASRAIMVREFGALVAYGRPADTITTSSAIREAGASLHPG
ncbi:hypothetical protein [Streptomyces coeruleorubidus]